MSSGEWIFLLIFGVGLLYLFVSLVLGDLFEISDVSDLAGLGTDAGVDFDAPAWFDLKVIAAGFVGFGAVGFIALQMSLSALFAVVLSMAGFVVVAGIAFYGVLLPLSKQQYNNLLSRQSYVGLKAKVVIQITSDEFGVVEIIDANGSRVSLKAYTDEGLFPTGADVLVYRVTDDGVYVMEDPISPTRT